MGSSKGERAISLWKSKLTTAKNKLLKQPNINLYVYFEWNRKNLILKYKTFSPQLKNLIREK